MNELIQLLIKEAEEAYQNKQYFKTVSDKSGRYVKASVERQRRRQG
jgi:hypothetical protein